MNVICNHDCFNCPYTAATNMLVNEMELSAIQKILGHTAISTTQIYTHTADQYLADQMRKLKY